MVSHLIYNMEIFLSSTFFAFSSSHVSKTYFFALNCRSTNCQKVRGKTAIWNQFFVGLYFVVLVIKCRVTLLCIAYNHHFEKAVKANQIKVFEALKEEGSTGEEGE